MTTPPSPSAEDPRPPRACEYLPVDEMRHLLGVVAALAQALGERGEAGGGAIGENLPGLCGSRGSQHRHQGRYLDWSEIDPYILGTLFERGLDPDKQSQLGAHYTDCEKIMLIIEPVVIRPWLADWERCKARIGAALEKEKKAKSPGAKTKAHGEGLTLFRAFLDRLRAFQVLDPACG